MYDKKMFECMDLHQFIIFFSQSCGMRMVTHEWCKTIKFKIFDTVS